MRFLITNKLNELNSIKISMAITLALGTHAVLVF